MSRPIIWNAGLLALFMLHTAAPLLGWPDPEPPPEALPAIVQWEEPIDMLQFDKVKMPQEDGPPGGWIDRHNPGSVPRLVRYLRSGEQVVQEAALLELAGMGRTAWAAVPAILDTLHDPNSEVRLMAAATLIEMSVRTRTAVGFLMEELRAREAARREMACRQIGALIETPELLGASCWGPDPPPPVARPWLGKWTLAALVVGLRDQHPRVRQEAAWALGQIGRRGKAAVPALTAALRDEDAKVRETAAKSLERIAPKARRAARR
jgi:hypothetical protein